MDETSCAPVEEDVPENFLMDYKYDGQVKLVGAVNKMCFKRMAADKVKEKAQLYEHLKNCELLQQKINPEILG